MAVVRDTVANVQAVTDYILACVDVSKGESITNLRLQKLLYLCQGYHLVEYGCPMFTNAIEAWPRGPVVPDVWERFSENQLWQAIDTESAADKALPGTIPLHSIQMICGVLKAFGHLSGWKPPEETPGDDPWLVARGDLSVDAPSSTAISLGLMQEYFAHQQ